MTSLTTFLLGNFFFNLKQLSKFEWVFLFFFSHTNLTFDKKTQKKKQNEEKKYEINGPGQANKKNSAGGINRGEKRNFSPHSQVAFFFPCDQWQQVFLFETSSICLPEWLCWKKKRNNSLTKCKRSRRRIQPKKNNIAALNWKKKTKKLWTQSMQKKRCNKSEWKNFSITFYHWACVTFQKVRCQEKLAGRQMTTVFC